MKIGINFTHLIPGKIGGMENYMRSVVYYFPKIKAENEYVIFAHKEIEETLPTSSDYKIVYVENHEPWKLSVELRNKVEEFGIDVWWSPLLVLDPLDLRIPSAFTIPDMQHEYYPDFFAKDVLSWRRKIFKLSAFVADAIFTLSENAKEDISKFLDVNPAKITATHLDSSPWFDQILNEERLATVKSKYQLPDDFIFFPANTWPHKNHKNLIVAFDLLKKKFPDLHLILTGYRSNAHSDILKKIGRSKNSKFIKFLGYIDNEEMPYVYKSAKCLVFPSLFEGFGIPIIEAMRSDCPVACSNNTSLPEVAGDACIYFDPIIPEDIAQNVEKLIGDNDLRCKLIEKGRAWAKKFSYKNCAQQILNKLEELNENGDRKSPDNRYPLVSIITPSYNQGRFIRRTIDSVLKQKETYPNIEYVVIDGGSTDDTIEILKSYGKRVRWMSQRDNGQTDAINRGLMIAKGEIVAWLNSDDTYESNAIAEVVNFFKQNPEASFVHGEGNHIDVDDNFIERYPSEKCSFERFHSSCPICQPTAFWKKKVTNEIGLLNESWNFGMDYDYWIRISKRYDLHFLPIHLGNTRVYKNTKTFNDPQKPNWESLRIISSHYETVSSNWIYSYAHAKLHDKLRNSRWDEFVFRLNIIRISFPLFLKFNKKIPKSEIRNMWNWFSGGLLSYLKIWK